MKGLLKAKDRRWGNWKERAGIREKLSFHSSPRQPADNSCISDSCSAFAFAGTAIAERLPLEIALTDGRSLHQPQLQKLPEQQQREG